MRDYIISRALEPSTWRGLVLIASALGAALSPDQKDAIVTGGLLLAGIIGAAVPDKSSKENRK